MSKVVAWLFQATPDGATNLQAIIVCLFAGCMIYALIKSCVEAFHLTKEETEEFVDADIKNM